MNFIFSLSDSAALILVVLISLLTFGLSIFATLKVSNDRSIPGWLRIVLIIVFFGWPIIAPAIYLYIRYRDKKKQQEAFSPSSVQD